MRRAVAETGRIDVLVNNGQGIPPPSSLLNKPDADFDYALRTAFLASKWLMTEAFPTMRDQGGGAIVNIASQSGQNGGVNQGDYSAAKEAIRSLTRTAANEWGRYNIRVNVVNPAAESAGLRNWAEANPEFYKLSQNWIPMKRYGDPEHDVGSLILGLVTDEAGFITGQTFSGEGGLSALHASSPARTWKASTTREAVSDRRRPRRRPSPQP